MAVLADVGGADVSWALADGVDPVVAAGAVPRDVYMIEVGGNPGDRRVAVVTGVAALDMRRVLARCDRAVVARAAGADDLRVIDNVGRRPDHIVMAVLAEIARIDVSGALARRLYTVMAARAVVDDIGMIEVGRYPCVGCVAVVAIIAAADVRWVLAGSNSTVVA